MFERNRNWMIRLLCLVMVVTMLFSFAACDEGSSPAQTTNPSQTTVTPQPTDPDSTALEYTLTQAGVDEFYRLLEEAEQLALADENLYTVEKTFAALEECYLSLVAQNRIAVVQHYSHTSDKKLEDQYLDSVDICTEANDAYLQMARRIYMSDVELKEYLFEDWSDVEIAQLLSYDEKIVQLQQRNAEISVEYRTSTDDDYKIKLYIEMVGNNNQIAQIYGYDNYYEYAYDLVYDRDYGMDEVAQIRRYAEDYLCDIMYDAEENYYDSYSALNFLEEGMFEAVVYNDYDSLGKDYVGLYMEASPKPLRDAMKNMLEKNSMFADGSDAELGAFTISIGERPYCYFGPGYASGNTVVHEGGHYYAGLYTYMDRIPLDLAEVHSQANEWLYISFLEQELSAYVHQAMVDYLLLEDVMMIMVCLMVDEFEQRVYSTDLTYFTAEDFYAIMDQIVEKYFPNGELDAYADMNSYWPQVVVEQPVYYISYAVSSIASISLYTVADNDWDEATEIYRWLCESFDMDKGFLGNVREAGLHTPFDEEFYISFSNLINSR